MVELGALLIVSDFNSSNGTPVVEGKTDENNPSAGHLEERYFARYW